MKNKDKPKPLAMFSYERLAIALIWIGMIVIVLVLLMLLSDSFIKQWMTMDQDARLGNMGQLLEGTVGSLWALAGVVLVYEALRFQRLELKAQRQEFELNRQEVMEQTLQLRLQNVTLQTQAFESSFFQLLTLYNEIVSGIEILLSPREVPLTPYEKAGNYLRGRKCFFEYYKIFNGMYDENVDLTGIATPTTEEFQDLINETYLTFFNKYQANLGHYFRNIHNIIRFIDKAEARNKGFYFSLFHDHLSNYELLLLFYHFISDEGSKIKPLIEKYSLLENLPNNELFDRRHMDLYIKHAFGQNIF